MKCKLKMGLILLSAIILLLPGAYGLRFSMGIFDGTRGASENLQINAGLETTFSSSIDASPEYYSNTINGGGNGPFSFDETFHSLGGGEHARLIAKWSDSAHYAHDFSVEQTGERIKVSQLMAVDKGLDIQSSAQAWNSLGQSAKVGIKIPEGSLKDYSNYGDAMDESVTAGQNGIILKGTKFNVFSEASKIYSLQRSSSTVKSFRDLSAETTCYVDSTTSRTRSKIKAV
ncbi:MAG TPA: hypothetical protein VMY43_10945 [Methanothrix sp.]|nr:hypothetical protein [Methanothrix sp.]